MRHLRILLLLLGAIPAGCHSIDDRVDSDVFAFEVRVVDDRTEAPIGGVKLLAWGPYHTTIAILEPEKRDSLGFTAITDADGRASVQVSFLREWPQVMASDGSPPEIRWVLDGSISLSRSGYEDAMISIAEALGFQFITHSTSFPEILIRMKNEPNKPLQGTGGKVPSSSTEPEALRP
jgi:hypothetical protein